MEKKLIYQTKFKKPIYDGQSYVAVLDDNSIVETIATINSDSDERVRERFLSKSGAIKFIKNNPIKEKPKVKTKSEEETFEEKMKLLHCFKQLEFVESKEDFEKWKTRNSIRIGSAQNTFGIIKGNGYILKIIYSVRGGLSCCGAREMGSHGGEVDSNYSRHLTLDIYKILCKYIIKDFEKRLKEDFSNFGVISYILSPGDQSHYSGRIGLLLDESDLFHKTATFVNPNTTNKLDLYTITDKWNKI